jgi:hypothetical protein
MKRRLFTILSAVSLVLCVATCVFEAQGVGMFEVIDAAHWREDPQTTRLSEISITGFEGRICIGISRNDFKPAAHIAGLRATCHQGLNYKRMPNVVSALVYLPQNGFKRRAGENKLVKIVAWELVFPAWLAIVLSAVLPMGWTISRFLRWRAKAVAFSTCQTCGYDLRATPERCPECGAIVEKTTKVIPVPVGRLQS